MRDKTETAMMFVIRFILAVAALTAVLKDAPPTETIALAICAVAPESAGALWRLAFPYLDEAKPNLATPRRNNRRRRK